MDDDLAGQRAVLVALTHESDDPQVRHRAHGLLDVIDSPSKRATADRLEVSVKSLSRWRARFLAEGGEGLRDRPRPGRPPLLSAAARELLGKALEEAPMSYGYPTTNWTIADLTDLLARRTWEVSSATVNRAVHALGYVHRRPRHDLQHRQDAEAVASAKHTLAVLQKKGVLTAAECGSSISMSVNFIPIPTWQRGGSDGACRDGFPLPAPIAG